MSLTNRLWFFVVLVCGVSIGWILSSHSFLQFSAKTLKRVDFLGPLVQDPKDAFIVTLPAVLLAGEAPGENFLHYSITSLSGPGHFEVELWGETSVKTPPAEVNVPDSAWASFVQSTLPHTEGRVKITAPEKEGQYSCKVSFVREADKAVLFTKETPVMVRKREVVNLVETDKPYYKPGQAVKIRIITLTAELRPRETPPILTVQIMDPKGYTVGRWSPVVDEFGLASIDFPLSSEPNLGSWTVLVIDGENEVSTGFIVDKYVLPKFEVGIQLTKGYITEGERDLSGKITATYSYGQPVRGKLAITVKSSQSGGQVFAALEQPINGQAFFEIKTDAWTSPAYCCQDYQLEATVIEEETEDQFSATAVVPMAQRPVNFEFSDELIKPGLPFSMSLKTTTPDKLPLDQIFIFEFKFFGKAENKDCNQPPDQPRHHHHHHPPHDRREKKVASNNDCPSFSNDVIETKSVTVSTRQGLAQFIVETPKGATSLEISHNKFGQLHRVTSAHSPSEHYISLLQTSTSLDLPSKPGQSALFSVYSTNNFSPTLRSPMYYQVHSQGQIKHSGVLTSGNTISVPLTANLAPMARLMVFSPSEAEVVAAYCDFAITNSLPNPISTEFSQESSRPASEINITSVTSPHSKVGFLAIDKSITIMGGNSQFDAGSVLRELAQFSPIISPAKIDFWARKRVGITSLFTSSGTRVLSNLLLTADEEDAHRGMMPMFEMVKFKGANAKMAVAMDMVMEDDAVDFDGAAPPGAAPEKAQIRSFFPETWLWGEALSDDKGELSFATKVPDSITSWSLFSFSLSKELGLGIAPVTELPVMKPFFVSLDLPYSSVFGEEVPIKLALYNYLSTPLDIEIALTPSPKFETSEPNLAQKHTVEPGRVKAVVIYIKPKVIGLLPLLVRASGKGESDAIQKDLLVESPGVRERVMKNIIVTHKTDGITEARIDLATPASTFPGSGKAIFTLNGDLMGPTLNGLDSLLQMPSGCGEQNMLNFAPDVFVTRYLKLTKQAKPEIEKKAMALMLTGYQRELTFIHNDGSFSAFGNSDASGSLWLTAFVLKTFAQAKGLIFIDNRVLEEAERWIANVGAPDGSYPPVGQVIHTSDLMGGEKGLVANTAFVAIALLEAESRSSSLQKTIKYLESKVNAESDLYTLAITAYALSLAKSPQAAVLLEALKARSILSEDKSSAHWSATNTGATSTETRGSCLYCAGSITNLDIEATAYALLAFVNQPNGDKEFSQQVSRWLMQQRTSNGGFLSTQDTCVALQALTSFVQKMAFAGDSSLKVSLRIPATESTAEFSHYFKINKDNFDVHQRVELPTGGELEILVEGRGTAVLETELLYNLEQEAASSSKGPFEIQVKMRKLAEQRYEAQSCIQVNMNNDPGMTLLEVGLPTGFTANRADLEKLLEAYPALKRVEIEDKKVILYLNGLDLGKQLCLNFPILRSVLVHELQPPVSTAFAYYSPHLRSSLTSPLPEL